VTKKMVLYVKIKLKLFVMRLQRKAPWKKLKKAKLPHSQLQSMTYKTAEEDGGVDSYKKSWTLHLLLLAEIRLSSHYLPAIPSLK